MACLDKIGLGVVSLLWKWFFILLKSLWWWLWWKWLVLQLTHTVNSQTRCCFLIPVTKMTCLHCYYLLTGCYYLLWTCDDNNLSPWVLLWHVEWWWQLPVSLCLLVATTCITGCCDGKGLCHWVLWWLVIATTCVTGCCDDNGPCHWVLWWQRPVSLDVVMVYMMTTACVTGCCDGNGLCHWVLWWQRPLSLGVVMATACATGCRDGLRLQWPVSLVVVMATTCVTGCFDGNNLPRLVLWWLVMATACVSGCCFFVIGSTSSRWQQQWREPSRWPCRSSMPSLGWALTLVVQKLNTTCIPSLPPRPCPKGKTHGQVIKLVFKSCNIQSVLWFESSPAVLKLCTITHMQTFVVNQ